MIERIDGVPSSMPARVRRRVKHIVADNGPAYKRPVRAMGQIALFVMALLAIAMFCSFL